MLHQKLSKFLAAREKSRSASARAPVHGKYTATDAQIARVGSARYALFQSGPAV